MRALWSRPDEHAEQRARIAKLADAAKKHVSRWRRCPHHTEMAVDPRHRRMFRRYWLLDTCEVPSPELLSTSQTVKVFFASNGKIHIEGYSHAAPFEPITCSVSDVPAEFLDLIEKELGDFTAYCA